MIEEKLCTKCGIIKSTSEFGKNKTKKDGLQSYCKECVKKYKKKHYSDNKKYYLEKAKTYRQTCRENLNEYKKTLKCSICGENRWWVLDFHHTDPNKKEKHISHLIESPKKLQEELKKCIVVCSNCHRDLHYKKINLK